ncbi:MAG: addiction module toxin RelE [Prevotella sp.]|nr:addiction module toxin RelE [Prevotella sp.]
MNFEIHVTDYFAVDAKKLSKRYRSFADDYAEFLENITENPYQGVEIMPGVRKIRMAIKSKGNGKSGGARVITFTYAVSEEKGCVYLLLIYDKADASNVKKNVIKAILKSIGFDNIQLKTVDSSKTNHKVK